MSASLQAVKQNINVSKATSDTWGQLEAKKKIVKLAMKPDSRDANQSSKARALFNIILKRQTALSQMGAILPTVISLGSEFVPNPNFSDLKEEIKKLRENDFYSETLNLMCVIIEQAEKIFSVVSPCLYSGSEQSKIRDGITSLNQLEKNFSKSGNQLYIQNAIQDCRQRLVELL